MKSILTIGLISTMLAVLTGCNSNQSVYEGDWISEEEQEKINDMIEADQAELNEEPEEGEMSEETLLYEGDWISEEEQEKINDMIEADQASLEE